MTKADIQFNRVIFDSDTKKEFVPETRLKPESIKKCLLFASEMAYGRGYHKSQSFGGTEYNRLPNEIFINTFQGKLAELAIYNELSALGIRPDKMPEFDIWGKGKWEDCDFTLNNGKIRASVKSTKWFGNLLLLKKDKYNEKGEFLETFESDSFAYDFTFLVRISGVKSPKPEHYLEENDIDVEVTGFLTHSKFLEVIKEKQVIPKGIILGSPLIVDNYYIFAKDLIDIKYLRI